MSGALIGLIGALPATSSTRALWYLTRGTGLVSILLLTASVVLGVMENVRWAHPRWPKLVTAGLHKNISLLVVVFLAVHILTAVVDGFAPIGWISAFVPFASPYRPLWLGLGALAVDLLLALIVTSLVRQRIGYRIWRAVHWMAYACWPVAFLHGLGTGSDTRLGWAALVNLSCLAAVLGAVWWRIVLTRSTSPQVRMATFLGSLAATAGILGFLSVGPLAPGWARRAGTPASLLATASPAAAASPASPASPAATIPAGFRPPLRANFSGTVNQGAVDGQGHSTVTIAGSLSGGADGVLRVVLQGVALPTGGVEMTSSSAAAGPAGQPNLYTGRVSELSGTAMLLDLRDASGRSLRLTFDVAVAQDGTAAGRVRSVEGSE